MRDFRVLGPKWDVRMRFLSSRLRDLCGKVGWKIIRVRSNISRTDAYMNSQGLHKYMPDGIPALRRWRRHRVQPLTKKLFTIYTCYQRKYIKGVSLNISTTFQGRKALCKRVVSQHKTDIMFLCVCGGEGLFVSFCLGIFFLISLVVFCLLWFLFWEKERKKKGERYGDIMKE